MRYERIQEGTFLERPNRFIAYVEIEGVKETVHVKNTGRCAELFVPGARVCVQKSDNPQRKTQWDLIAVWKGERLINMDSQIPNALVREWLEETEDRQKLEKEILLFVKNSGGQVENLSLVYEEIHKKHPSFDIKDYGYSRLSSFLRSIRQLSVNGNLVSIKEKK